MGKNPSQLTQPQIDVLNWIKDGCPEGIYEGFQHRIVARALHRRGLVMIKGNGPTWSATITAAGRSFKPVAPPADTPAQAEADALIQRVLDAGDRIALPRGPTAEKEHERLVRMSLHSSNRPHGKRLAICWTGDWPARQQEIVFVEHFYDDVEATPVLVREHVAKYHPVVKAYLANKQWQYVTESYLPRATRILQAIADEAVRRGFGVLGNDDLAKRLDTQAARALSNSHLVLQTSAELYGIQIREISGPGAKQLPPWPARTRQPAWIARRGWEFVSTGRLELVIDGRRRGYGGTHHRDLKSARVEDQLAEVFQSFEVDRLQSEADDRERQRKKAERQRRWEAAMEEAKHRYDEHVRWEHFKRLSKEYQAVLKHREFLAVARSAADRLVGTERDTAMAQLDLANRLIESLDPLNRPELLAPAVKSPRPDELKPFLDGWSPFGPGDVA